jgi:hypothetical protein
MCGQFSVIVVIAKPFENGQYLDIYGITRDQAGEYECSAENDVSFPDVKKVRVIVNCKSLFFITITIEKCLKLLWLLY